MDKFVKPNFFDKTIDETQKERESGDFERDSDRSEVDRLLRDYVDS